jgi:putative SOS response-associated peptidase YedK
MAEGKKPQAQAQKGGVAPAATTPAPVAAATTTPAATEAPKPETVELKAIAEKLNLNPRETRVILRAIKYRGEDQKRARWSFTPAEVPDVIAKVKKYQADKAAAAEARAKAEEEEAKKKAAEAATPAK